MRLVLPLVISGLLLFCSHNSLAWEQQPPPQDGVEVWRDQGKPTEAHQLLRDLYTWFTEGFDTADLQDAKALLETLAG